MTTKRILAISLFLMAVVAAPIARAQTPASRLASLTVGLWPDFDRPSVLVLLTGALDAGVALPAAVVLPLPAAAEINAVARIDNGGRMVDDIEYHIGDGHLGLTTPDSRFRVEYYMPYRVEGVEHLFEFEWLAEISVERLEVKVQQPKAASGMLMVPEGVQAGTDENGLSYYVVPAQVVPAESAYTVKVRYAVEQMALSVKPRPARGAAAWVCRVAWRATQWQPAPLPQRPTRALAA